MNKFIFDVDGTLTPSRSKIDEDFKDYFLNFINNNETYLITGSDYSKTVEQLGEHICKSVKKIYNCSGNDVWEKGVNVHTNTWTLEQDVKDWLENKLKSSNFVLRTGNHIEARPGSINFSIVGRNATLKERTLYKEWDSLNNEREKISAEFNHTFKKLEARIGGETGIDIYPKGYDKSQIIRDFSKEHKLYFFGDKITPGGNDYPLASAITKNNRGMWVNVAGWRQTYETLQYYQEARIAS